MSLIIKKVLHVVTSAGCKAALCDVTKSNVDASLIETVKSEKAQCKLKVGPFYQEKTVNRRPSVIYFFFARLHKHECLTQKMNI